MNLGMGISLRLTMKCTVCRQTIDSGSEAEAFDTAMFGAAAYAVCICCNQHVKNQRKAYKKRYDKYVKEKT